MSEENCLDNESTRTDTKENEAVQLPDMFGTDDLIQYQMRRKWETRFISITFKVSTQFYYLSEIFIPNYIVIYKLCVWLFSSPKPDLSFSD